MNVSAEENVTQDEPLVAAGVKVLLVEFDEFTGYEFQAPASFFSRSAMGTFYFYCTRGRDKAQAACDELFGKGRYTVALAGTPKSSKKRPTCTGTHTRRGQTR